MINTKTTKLAQEINPMKIIVGLVLLAIIWTTFSPSTPVEKSAAQIEVERVAKVESQNMTILQNTILATAKDADSIKWIQMQFSTEASKTCVKYSGTNSFGGRVTETKCLSN